MKTLGVHLEKYFDKQHKTHFGNGIIASWNSTPKGFKFICLRMSDLVMELLRTQKFGLDLGIGFGVQRIMDKRASVSVRQNSRPSGFHLVGYKGGWFDKQKKRSFDYCNLHWDTVSPVSRINPQSKAVEYEPNETLQHILTDLLHIPVSLKDRAFVIRF